jgi:hypothetical protein
MARRSRPGLLRKGPLGHFFRVYSISIIFIILPPGPFVHISIV